MLGGSALAWGLLLSLLVLAGALAHLWRLSRSRRQLRSRLRVAHSELSEMRGRDALTGLVTRAAFELLLEPEVLRADREGTPLALLYVGLDGVRAVNESLGLRVGDGLLAQAAHRLSAFVGDAPEVARAGGDEFVLLLRADAPQALAAAAALHELLTRPFTVETHALGLGASIGIACYPEHGSRPRLISHAALAMRTVKLGGGEGQALYDPSMGVNMREQAELLQDLRQALARQELQLYFQPKVDARSLQVTAAEALLRWRHPRRGMISPDVFVPLAERHGLIAGIGAWVIEEACRQAAQWRRKGLRMRIAVNISGLQLRHESLVEQIEEALRRHRIPADRLTCEITETVAMEDTAVTRGAFERLRQAGLHVSIDDFGTGYSSLATLRRLPAEELKIDRAFVADLDLEGKSAHSARTIVRAIVQMAHSLQMRVVAEGVESATQRDELVALGCDELQGYLFARPMPAASLALWADGDGAAAGSMFRPSLFDPTAPAALEAAPGTATT